MSYRNKYQEGRRVFSKSPGLGIFSAIFILTIFTALSIADEVSLEPQPKYTKADALKIAQEYFGVMLYKIDDLANSDLDTIVTVREGTLFDIPFLGEPYKSKELYEMAFRNIDLRINKDVVKDDYLHIKNFLVLIDPSNGKLIQIISKNASDSTEFDIKPSYKKATEYLSGISQEILDFPDVPPNHTFYEAILAAHQCKPIYCREITALYVDYKFINGETMPVWYISCWWGKPDITGPESQSAPAYMTCNYSCIVDTSGYCRHLHTSPTSYESRFGDK